LKKQIYAMKHGQNNIKKDILQHWLICYFGSAPVMSSCGRYVTSKVPS